MTEPTSKQTAYLADVIAHRRAWAVGLLARGRPEDLSSAAAMLARVDSIDEPATAEDASHAISVAQGRFHELPRDVRRAEQARHRDRARVARQVRRHRDALAPAVEAASAGDDETALRVLRDVIADVRAEAAE